MLALSVKLHEDCVSKKLSNLKWSIEKPRRHWKFSKHCNDILLPKSLPNVALLTDEIKFYWYIYSSNGKHDECYQKDLNYSLRSTLSKVSSRNNVCLKHIILSEQLINLEQFDLLNRKNFINLTINLIRAQSALKIVCLEGLKLTRIEGYKILSALTTSKKCIKFLYFWRVFKRNEYSLSKDRIGLQNFSILRNDHHWLRAIGNLKFLEVISLNYVYIASETGDLLIHLSRQLGKNWNYLQLLCLEEEIPGTFNQTGNKHAVTIPDFAWNEARKWSPKLKVQIILLGIPEYDLHKIFLTQSIPVQTIVLTTNLKLLHHKPCMLDCTFKIVCNWYHRSLVQLHVNFLNHREMLDNHLRKLFPSLPNLKIFEFVGEVKDLITICTMCCQIKFRVCAVEKINMQLQSTVANITQNTNWLSRINCLLASFKDDFDAIGVIFEIHSYPI